MTVKMDSLLNRYILNACIFAQLYLPENHLTNMQFRVQSNENLEIKRDNENRCFDKIFA